MLAGSWSRHRCTLLHDAGPKLCNVGLNFRPTSHVNMLVERPVQLWSIFRANIGLQSENLPCLLSGTQLCNVAS